jgi:hypothetical protein
MGSTGCCHDNAVAGAFFASLKREIVRCRSWFTRKDLQSAVFDDVEGFYSTRGLHSTLGYASPAEHAHATSRANASAKAVQSPSLWRKLSGFAQQQPLRSSPDPRTLRSGPSERGRSSDWACL